MKTPDNPTLHPVFTISDKGWVIESKRKYLAGSLTDDLFRLQVTIKYRRLDHAMLAHILRKIDLVETKIIRELKLIQRLSTGAPAGLCIVPTLDISITQGKRSITITYAENWHTMINMSREELANVLPGKVGLPGILGVMFHNACFAYWYAIEKEFEGCIRMADLERKLREVYPDLLATSEVDPLIDLLFFLRSDVNIRYFRVNKLVIINKYERYSKTKKAA